MDTRYGFNKYSLLDVDSGKQITAHRHQLLKLDVIELDFDSPMDTIEGDAGPPTQISTLPSEDNETNEPNSTTRFLSVTENDLDKLASERSSQTTQQQTKWGIKVFRGTCNMSPPLLKH